ncbi:Light-sensor Protein kinase, partial [Quaeritorhiza haematococci]
ETVSCHLERLTLQDAIEARKSIALVTTRTLTSGNSMMEHIQSHAQELLTMFEAATILISIDGNIKFIGDELPSTEAAALVNHIRERKLQMLSYTSCVKDDYPNLGSVDIIGGFLYMPLSPRFGEDFLIFVRKERIEHENWTGNLHWKSLVGTICDYAKEADPEGGYVWRGTVRGHSKPWQQNDVEMATFLHLLYSRFLEVWRQKEKALQESRLKNILLANVSHEVRTPLNALINYLELCLEEPITDEVKKYLTRCYQAGKSLIAIINDLLDLTRIEAGKMPIRHEPFNLRETMRVSFNMFECKATTRNLDFTLSGVDTLPETVLGDEGRFRQVIANLCSNALKFTEKGSVRVVCSAVEVKEGSVVCKFQVVDTGPGIPRNKLNVIFDAFEQVNAEQQQRQGAGLGLAIVSRIVKAMKGSITVESELRKGSTFTVVIEFKIPKEAPTQKGVLAGKVSQSSESSGDVVKDESMYILVAEDDPINRKIIESRLSKLGHRVLFAKDGEEAVELFLKEGHALDVIFM